MSIAEHKISVLSDSKYYPRKVDVPQRTAIGHNNLSMSSSCDDMLRVYFNQDLVYHDRVTKFTYEVSSKLERILNVLTNTIKSLKLTQDYNGTYIAYLSGHLSHEDFLEDAKKYSYTPSKELSPETIKDIKILFNTTKIEFSPSDIAEIFKIAHDKSVDAIKQLEIPSVQK